MQPATTSVGAAHAASGVIRWGWYSLAVNVVLLGLHAAIAAASGSLAVAAETIHNFVDLVAAAALLAGLKIAARKSKAFPYGLYKVENLVAAGIALLVFITAYEVISSVVSGSAAPPRANAWMLAVLVATTALPVVFGHFELRAGKAANSPALIADAREYRVHAYTTGLAFAALLSAWFEFPLDRIAALVIVVMVAKTGWDLLADALRVLLDASLSAQTLGEIRERIGRDPAVAEVKWITGRNAGRYRFVEAGVALRLTETAKAAAALERIEKSVREGCPQVERVLLHAEARSSERVRYAIPLADPTGTISEHLGDAPYFAFVDVERPGREPADRIVRENPHRFEEHRKGIRVAEWLAAEKADIVLVRREPESTGPIYVFRDAGINVRRTEKRTVAEALSGQQAASSAPNVPPVPRDDLPQARRNPLEPGPGG